MVDEQPLESVTLVNTIVESKTTLSVVNVKFVVVVIATLSIE